MSEQARLNPEQAAAQLRIPCIRLWLLRVLEVMPRYSGNDEFMRTALAYIGLPIARAELLEQLKFLAERKLVTLDHRAEFNIWVVALTGSGQDVALGLAEAEGIAQPQAQNSGATITPGG